LGQNDNIPLVSYNIKMTAKVTAIAICKTWERQSESMF